MNFALNDEQFVLTVYICFAIVLDQYFDVKIGENLLIHYGNEN